jgi:hypothetical protein
MKLSDKFKKCAGVYIFTNLVNGKQYVGESKNIAGRFASYRTLKENDQIIIHALRRYTKENFEIYVEYLPDFDKKSLLDLEEELIKKLNCLVPNGYNSLPRGRDRTGYKPSEETKKRVSMSLIGNKRNLGKKWTTETREKVSKSRIGYKHSKETKRKISEAHKGKVFSETHIKNISIAQKNNKYLRERVVSDETREKLSKANKGKVFSEETRKKMSESRKLYFLNRHI